MINPNIKYIKDSENEGILYLDEKPLINITKVQGTLMTLSTMDNSQKCSTDSKKQASVFIKDIINHRIKEVNKSGDRKSKKNNGSVG